MLRHDQSGRMLRRGAWALVLAIVVALALGILISCADELQGPKSVVFENRLDQEVFLYQDGKLEGSLRPNSVTSAAWLVRGSDAIERLEARTADGWVITDQRLTPTPHVGSTETPDAARTPIAETEKANA